MRHAKLGVLLAIIGLSLAASAQAEGTRPARGTLAVAKATPARSRSVEVLWGGRWWPAEVLQRRAGLVKIHYTGWGPEWDEWVEPPRVRAAIPIVTLKSARVGQRVSIEWHGRWWDGEVIDARSGFYKVHYAGWGPEWDEWLEPSRLRAGRSAH